MTGDAAPRPPVLDGAFATDEVALAEAADDWGHLVHRRPVGVARPGSADDVVRIVRFARERGLKLSPRGAGHTTYGQSQADAGVVVDMRSLNAVAVGGGRARV